MRFLIVLALTATCCAQRNELSVSAAGNFNPTSYIWIQNAPHDVLSTNRSSLGGGASYQHWVVQHVGFGAQYEQNPSDGKLLWNGREYIWPLMRYEFMAFSSQRIIGDKVTVALKEGAWQSSHKVSVIALGFSIQAGAMILL